MERGSLSLFQAVGLAKGWQGWRWVPWGKATPTLYLFFIFLLVRPRKHWWKSVVFLFFSLWSFPRDGRGVGEYP